MTIEPSAADLWDDDPQWSYRDDWWVRWLQQQTGALVDPREHSDDHEGFNGYVGQLGIESFRAHEVFRPAYPARWASCFGDDPRAALGCKPTRHAWPRLCCPLWLWQRIRWACDRPIPLVSVWRPEPYNGGAPHSDHLWGCAADAQPSGRTASGESCWELAVRMLQQWYGGGTLSLSVGYYSDHEYPDIHIGVGAPRTMSKRALAKRNAFNRPRAVGRDWDYRKDETRRVPLMSWKP